jgi:hypothetical protein
MYWVFEQGAAKHRHTETTRLRLTPEKLLWIS